MGGKAAKTVPFLSTIEGEYELNIEQAKLLEADARYNADQRRKQGDLLMGEQIAAFGASGVELEGTPMNMITEDRKQAEIEAMNIIFSGKQNANMMKRKAILARTGAYMELAKSAGMMAFSAGAFKGAGGAGATTMKNGGGFDTASTGTNGFTIGENSSATGFANRGLA